MQAGGPLVPRLVMLQEWRPAAAQHRPDDGPLAHREDPERWRRLGGAAETG